MTNVAAAAFSQQNTLSIIKTTDVSVERSVSALSGSVSIGGQVDESGPFSKVFDVLDISEDAQEKLIQDREDAEKLAQLLKGEEAESPIGLPRNLGRIQIDFSAIEVTERFSFTQSYELSLVQQTAFAVQGDEGNFEVTRSTLSEIDLSRTIAFERTQSLSTAQSSLSVSA